MLTSGSDDGNSSPTKSYKSAQLVGFRTTRVRIAPVTAHRKQLAEPLDQPTQISAVERRCDRLNLRKQRLCAWHLQVRDSTDEPLRRSGPACNIPRHEPGTPSRSGSGRAQFFEDQLEDQSYFLSYNYPIRVGMAHHEGRTVRLAMALRITCRMDRSDLHHLRRNE